MENYQHMRVRHIFRAGDGWGKLLPSLNSHANSALCRDAASLRKDATLILSCHGFHAGILVPQIRRNVITLIIWVVAALSVPEDCSARAPLVDSITVRKG